MLVVIDWFGPLKVSLIVAICDLIVRWLVQAFLGCKMSMIALILSSLKREIDILGSFYNSISILRLNARVLYCSMKVTRLRKEEGRERTFFCFHIASFPFGNLPNHPSILALSQPIAPAPSVLLVTSCPVSCNIKSTIHISIGRMV